MVLVQKWPFFQLRFLGNTSQENVFYDIVERKKNFLGYKNKKIKKSKNWPFSKVVNPWFWSKNGHFYNCFFLGNTSQENVFYDILERKNAFLAYKNKKIKKSRNWHFFKGLTHGLGPKMVIFSSFIFRQYRPGKRLLWYSRTKKHLFRLLKHEVQKVEKLTFFQRG